MEAQENTDGVESAARTMEQQSVRSGGPSETYGSLSLSLNK